ncbi:TPA: hypothetical protein ACKOR7_003005 [Clostridioides difficile]
MSKLDEIEKAFLNNEFDIGFKIEKEKEVESKEQLKRVKSFLKMTIIKKRYKKNFNQSKI